MTPEIRLGTLTDYLDLTDPQAHLLLTIDAPTPAEGATVRAVGGPIQVGGATADALWANKSAIEAMLVAARKAHVQRRPPAERVSLQVRAGTTDWTYIDVIGGTLDVTEHLPTGLFASGTLTMACRPLFRGAALQAQNLLTAPTDPTNAAWTATNITATANATTAPDGSTTAATLLETTDNAAHTLHQELTKAATATQYTFSAYVKPAGRTVVHLSMVSGANGATAGYDLTAGTVSSAAALISTGWADPSAAIEDAGGGWWRIALTATSDADATVDAYLALSNGSSTSYAGNATLGIRLWGVQMEESDSAGLLLVPTYHPDTVTAAYTIPGYTLAAVAATYANDPDNLIVDPSSAGWTAFQSTLTASQADPAGGTAAVKFVENTNNNSHYARSDQATLSSGTNTAAIYLKQQGRSKVRMLFSSLNTTTGYVVTVDFTAGTVSAPTLLGGSGFASPTAEIIDMGSGWFWVRITSTTPAATDTASIYVTFDDVNPATTYAGDNSSGVYTWRPQIVAGGTIDEPTPAVPEEYFPPVEMPAVTESAGQPSGAFIYGIPGDADAIYRVELDDASSAVAVNRVHIGAWSGPSLLLDSIAPFSVATAASEAGQASGIAGQVGEWVPTLGADATWTAVGTVALADVVGRRGAVDIVARVRDESAYIGQPASLRVEVSDGAYFRRLARVSDNTGSTLTSQDVGRPRVTPGATLVLLTQGYKTQSSAGDTATSTATITADGGLTWTQIHTGSARGAFSVWVAEDVAELTGTITVGYSVAVKYPVTTLLELVGAASSSVVETADEYTVVESRTTDPELTITAGPMTNTQAHAVYLSAGLGLNVWGGSMAAITATNDSSWMIVSSLSSGAIAYRTVTTSAARSVTWNRPVDGAVPEEWIATLAVFKAATATGASVTAGEWSIVVTAVDAAGNESLPTGVVAVSVPSASSAVSVSWSEPQNGTAASYRVYRNRGSGWAYTTVTAPDTSYLFTSEAGLTTANPPTTPPPVAAWRLSVALPSGETLWRAQTSVASVFANSTWEDIDLGTVPIPAIAGGEGATPDGALLVVEASHLTGAQVGVNGLWGYSPADGQMVAYRVGMDAEDTPEWVLETNRDGVPVAWLRNAATGGDAGQPAVRGQLTLASGNAQLVIRPEVAGGESDLVNADLRITRVLVTPRWRYLIGSGE